MKRRLRFRYQAGGSSSDDPQVFRVEMKSGRFRCWQYVHSLFIRGDTNPDTAFAELVAKYREGFRYDTEVEL